MCLLLSVLLRRPRATLVSVSGLHKLVQSARIPYQAAQDFKDWVTNTVLPYIRGEAYAGTPFRQKVIDDLRKNRVPAARPPAVTFDGVKSEPITREEADRIRTKNCLENPAAAPSDFNFERAREEAAKWPEWKQGHALTKHSEAVHTAHAPGAPASAPPQPQGQPTMSSREIAELTGKEHKHVLFDIRKMLVELSQESAEFSATYTHPQNGQSYVEFRLPKDLTITLVSGYSVTMRHRIVTRWMELEAAGSIAPAPAPAPAFKLPQSFAEALRLSADLQEENERLAEEKRVLALAEQQALAAKELAEKQRDKNRAAADALAQTMESEDDSLQGFVRTLDGVALTRITGFLIDHRNPIGLLTRFTQMCCTKHAGGASELPFIQLNQWLETNCRVKPHL